MVVAVTWCTMLVRREVMPLVRTRGEVRLLLGIATTTWGHCENRVSHEHSNETMQLTVSWLLTSISRLSRRHEHHRLRRLA